jgi:hypothetical protein
VKKSKFRGASIDDEYHNKKLAEFEDFKGEVDKCNEIKGKTKQTIKIVGDEK